jgi:hypothetical protein
MIWAALFWTGFGIAALALAVGVYYAAWWAVDRLAPLRHEAWIGVAMALLYGAPFWIGVPLLARWRRHLIPARARHWSKWLPMLALVLLAASIALSGYGT